MCRPRTSRTTGNAPPRRGATSAASAPARLSRTDAASGPGRSLPATASPRSWPIRTVGRHVPADRPGAELGGQLAAQGVHEDFSETSVRCAARRRCPPPRSGLLDLRTERADGVAVGAGHGDDRHRAVLQPTGVQRRGGGVGEVVPVGGALLQGLVRLGAGGRRPVVAPRSLSGPLPRAMPAASARKTATSETMW